MNSKDALNFMFDNIFCECCTRHVNCLKTKKQACVEAKEIITQDLEKMEELKKINYIQSLYINEIRKYVIELKSVCNDKADYYNLYIKFSCTNEKDLFDILTTLKLKEEYETIRCSKEVAK